MRRRRRTKYYWLPTFGTPNTIEGQTIASTLRDVQLGIATQDIIVSAQPVVANDTPDQTAEQFFPLNDIIGNEYIVKRIVGKVYAEVIYNSAATPNFDISNDLPSVVVGAGFYVSRTDATANGQLGEAALPVDFSGAGGLLYNPLNVALTREPWMWRRTWLLGPGGLNINHPFDSLGQTQPPTWLTSGGILQGKFPWNNSSYGSVADGPHVDCKTGRRVRQDEALFFGAAAHAVPLGAALATGLEIDVRLHWDVRVLGALRRAKNRSNF